MNVFNILVSVILASVVVDVHGEVFSCVNYSPRVCTMDLIPFCLTNGTMVTGRCAAQRAVCVDEVQIDETFSMCSKSSVSNFDCARFNPMVCTRDAIAFCLTNGTIIRGSCFAKRAVCLEDQTVDDSFSACNKIHKAHRQTNFDCAQFNPMICAKDAISFCLTNGTVVTGSCTAKKAVCLENKMVDDDFSSCSAGGRTDMTDNNNAATSIQAALSLLLMALICTFF